jgi:hypothetical protein
MVNENHLFISSSVSTLQSLTVDRVSTKLLKYFMVLVKAGFEKKNIIIIKPITSTLCRESKIKMLVQYVHFATVLRQPKNLFKNSSPSTIYDLTYTISASCCCGRVVVEETGNKLFNYLLRPIINTKSIIRG